MELRLVCALASIVLLCKPGCALEITSTAPAASTRPRDEQSVLTDLRATHKQLLTILPALPLITDARFREANRHALIPLSHRAMVLLDELRSFQSDGNARAQIDNERLVYLAMFVALGDQFNTNQLADTRNSGGPIDAWALSGLALGSWWRDSKNPAAQSGILDEYLPTVKANPTADSVVTALATMATFGAANDDLAKRVLDILRSTASGPLAKQALADIEAANARKSMIGKALVIKGRDTENGAWSSWSMRGKVILVDCWATWCGPCNAEIPRVKHLYDVNHAKGFEVVGIDCDDSDETVNAFTKAHGMPWIQLRELSQTQDPWHPLATQWHVTAIPAMFLIDKKGILRFIDAGDDTDTKIAQLLAEKP